MPNRIYTMTVKTLKLRQSKGSKENCQTCNIQIKVGDSVVTRMGNQSRSRPIRHEACARRMNVI